MKERPILFSGEMVKAILDGRKTQTRRVMKPQPPSKAESCAPFSIAPDKGFWHEEYEKWWLVPDDIAPYEDPTPHTLYEYNCPYGKVGDRLWVRETWQLLTSIENDFVPIYIYRADEKRATKHAWEPSIFMPRAASRILLEVTGVRVERVQEITEADAKAEGASPYCKYRRDGVPVDRHCSMDCEPNHYRYGYRRLWDSINAKREGGKYSWASDPFVWVVEFKRVEVEKETAAAVDRQEEG